MNKKNQNTVTFLLTQDLESPSGLGRYLPLAKNLSKEGFIVSIFALHSNFYKLQHRSFYIDEVKVTYVAQMHVRKESNQTQYFSFMRLIWISILATWKLLVHAIRLPVDTIVIGKPHPMNSIAGLIGRSFHGSRIILDCDDYEAASNYFSSTWQQWIIKKFENTMPKLVDHITTNTYFNKERMMGLGVPAEKIDYVPNGIDKERFTNLDPLIEAQIRQSLNLEGKKVIAYIGSLSLANHPVDLLIHAFKLINEIEDETNLLIVGGGKDIDVLKALVKNHGIEKSVKFVGRVSSDLVPYYYKLAHVTVDPVYDNDSARGRCPLKMFESWAMSKPYVTSNVGDRCSLVGNDLMKLLSKPGDHESLAQKIILLLNDSELANDTIHAGNRKVVNYYWDYLTNNNIHVYS